MFHRFQSMGSGEVHMKNKFLSLFAHAPLGHSSSIPVRTMVPWKVLAYTKYRSSLGLRVISSLPAGI